MKVSDGFLGLIRSFVALDIKREKVRWDEFYEAVSKMSKTAGTEAEEYIRKGEFKEAAKVYMLISKILRENAKHIENREVTVTLLHVASSWQNRAEQILGDEVNHYYRMVHKYKEKEDYEKATEYMNRATTLEHQIETRSRNSDLEREISDYYDSIRAEVDTRLKSQRPTAILSKKVGWVTKKLSLPKHKPMPTKTTPPEKAVESELTARRLVTPEKIATRNTFRKSSTRKDWYNWSIYLDADDQTKEEIESVTYTLHPTFPRPVRTVRDPSDGFKLSTAGWGEFQIKADIHLKSGETITKYHWLNLGSGRSRSPR